MMAMHTVAMCDGGGGGDSTTLLSMRDVIDTDQNEVSTRVLYAEPIDLDGVTAILDSLDTYSKDNNLGIATQTLIRDNDDMMSSTNSDRFYFGTEAKSQFTAMNDVGTKLATLLGNIDDICNNRATIISSVEAYNTKLAELKKDCRITLLRQAADAWNLAKHVDKTIHITGNCGYPYRDVVWGDSQYIYSEPITSTITVNTSIISMDGYVYYDYDRVYYKIIKYWTGLKNLTWFKDPGFEEVEKLFADVGAPLPYNPALIV